MSTSTNTTKAAIIAALTDAGVEHDPRDKKAVLAALLAASQTEDEDEGVVRMSSILSAYKPRYQPSTTATGRRSLNNGDALAVALSALLPADVAALAERLLDCGPLYRGDGTGRYDSLNPGQIRMNSGNRIRAAIKRGDITEEEALSAI